MRAARDSSKTIGDSLRGNWKSSLGPSSRSARERVSVREFREVVVADHVHFVSVLTHQTTQVVEANLPLRIVVGTLGGEERNGVIVLGQLDPEVVSIPGMQQPPIPLPDRHAAVPEGVAEQRDK
jgi:hypothetical protein